MNLDTLAEAERECCRLEAVYQEAVNTANRLKVQYYAQVQHVRELVRAVTEGVEVKERTLFDGEG